jgi:hypothetical protein
LYRQAIGDDVAWLAGVLLAIFGRLQAGNPLLG